VAPETVIVAAAVICAGILLAMVKLTRHFAAPQPISVTAEWLDQLSIEATDLLRLVGEEDGRSLHTHLPRLKDDFKLICLAVKVIIVQSNRDRPDLVRVLVRNKMTFAHRMMMVRFRLVYRRYGLGPWMSLV
jgi:hypothetical protein